MSKESLARAQALDRAGLIAVPNKVFDAMRRREITSAQFTILTMLFAWAEPTTGVARAVSLPRLCGILKEPDIRKVRRQMNFLKKAGWFTTNYRAGTRRPYHVTVPDSLSIAGDEQL